MTEKQNPASTNEEALTVLKRGMKPLFNENNKNLDEDDLNAVHDKAIKEFTEAIRLDPNCVSAYVLRGYTYSIKKQYDQAVNDLNEIIKLDPNNALAYISRGDIYCIKDQFDKAIDDYTKGIKLDPDYAVTYKQLEQKMKAINDYNKALNLNPNDKSAERLLKRIKPDMDDLDLDGDEKNDFTTQHVFGMFCDNEVIRIDPNDAKAYFRRGCSYMDDEYYKAIDDFTKAIRLDPDYTRVYFLRGYTYVSINQLDQAIEDFTEIIRLGLDPQFIQRDDIQTKRRVRDAYSFRGSIYKALDQYDKAIGDFTELIKLYPDDDDTYIKRGQVYKEMGEMDQAIQDFEKALSLNSDEFRKELINELIREIKENVIGTSELLKHWGRFLYL